MKEDLDKHNKRIIMKRTTLATAIYFCLALTACGDSSKQGTTKHSWVGQDSASNTGTGSTGAGANATGSTQATDAASASGTTGGDTSMAKRDTSARSTETSKP